MEVKINGCQCAHSALLLLVDTGIHRSQPYLQVEITVGATQTAYNYRKTKI